MKIDGTRLCQSEILILILLCNNLGTKKEERISFYVPSYQKKNYVIKIRGKVIWTSIRRIFLFLLESTINQDNFEELARFIKALLSNTVENV